MGNRSQGTFYVRISGHMRSSSCLLFVLEDVYWAWGAVAAHTWCLFICWFAWLLWEAIGPIATPSPESHASISWILIQLHDEGLHVVLEDTSIGSRRLGSSKRFRFNPFFWVPPLWVAFHTYAHVLYKLCVLHWKNNLKKTVYLALQLSWKESMS